MLISSKDFNDDPRCFGNDSYLKIGNRLEFSDFASGLKLFRKNI